MQHRARRLFASAFAGFLFSILLAHPIIASDDIAAQMDAGLIYAGYLSFDNVANTEERVFAFNDMVNDFNTQVNRGKVLSESFIIPPAAEYAPTEKGLTYLRRFMIEGIFPTQFKEDLESGNIDRISVAQNYLRFLGYENRNDGRIDNATYENAVGYMSRPVSDANAIRGQDPISLLNWIVTGAIPIPKDIDLAKYLRPKEIAAAMRLPSWSDKNGEFVTREYYIVNAMLKGKIGSDPIYFVFLEDRRQDGMQTKNDIIDSP